MPYKSESIKLTGLQDRRRKLTDEDRVTIQRKYATGLVSQRHLAKEYNVDKGTIAIIVNPERAKKVKEYRATHWRDYRPSKEDWAKTIREHRHYKQSLFLKGELKPT